MNLVYEGNAVLRASIVRTAQKFGFDEWATSEELLSQIENADSTVFAALQDVLTTTSEWFAFHKWVEDTGRTGQLDAEETAKLVKIVEAKKRARERLSELLA